MRDSDLTLVIDLIDGRLPPEEEKAALAAIEADPELRSAYRTQAAIAGELAATPTPSMTPSERETLHAELKAQLHLVEVPAVVPPAPSRRNRWLAPLAGLVIGAAAIFGAVVVLPGTLSGGADEANLALSATTTTAAAGTQMADTTVAMAEAAPEAPTEDDILSESGADEVTGEAGDAAAEIPFVADVELSELAVSYESGATLFDESAVKRSNDDVIDDERLASCLEHVSTGATDSAITPLMMTVYEGLPSVIVAVAPSSGSDYLVVYALDTCEEIATTRP